MQFKLLTYYAAIIEAGSFSAAAKDLYISQPTLSQAVQTMERELGFVLLKRTSTGVSPTNMGELVYRDARRLLDDYAAMRRGWEERNKANRSLSGTVRLVAFPTAYVFVSEKIVGRFRDTYPNIRWQLLEARGNNVPSVFEKGQAELGVGDYVSAQEVEFISGAAACGLTVTPLCPDVCRIAISKKNPASLSPDLSAEMAAHMPLAYYSGGDDVADPHFTRFFDSRLSIELHSFERIVEAAVNNLAVSPLPERITRQSTLSHYGQDAVRFATVDSFSLPVTHCLLQLSGVPLSPEAECVRELVIQAYSELGQVEL